MGDVNQFIYAKHVFKGFRGRVLEVGSKDYGNTQPFREFFRESEYCGVDLESGKNVDLVVDLEKGPGGLEGQKFDLIIICSVLEHSRQPWVIAKNLSGLLSDDGVLFSAHPWVWRYHKYPDDYFRFSPRGIQSLFDGLDYWLPLLYSTYRAGEFFSFTDDEGIDNKLALLQKDGRKYLPYLQTVMSGTKSKARAEALESNLKNAMQNARS